MSTNAPFLDSGDTVSIAVTAASQTLALTPSIDKGATVRAVVSGTVPVFLNFGPSTVTATLAAGMPMLASSSEVFALGTATHVAVIASGAGSTVYFTTGAGD